MSKPFRTVSKSLIIIFNLPLTNYNFYYIMLVGTEIWRRIERERTLWASRFDTLFFVCLFVFVIIFD